MIDVVVFLFVGSKRWNAPSQFWMLACLVLLSSSSPLFTVHADAAAAENGGVTEYPAENCSMDCQNGGYCTYIYDPQDRTQLLREIRSGQLVEHCVCQPGFGGRGCEMPVEACDAVTNTCFNKIPCIRNPTTQTDECDCAWADRVSNFAGRMCRKPYTEYCSGRYNENDALTYCTNGGKCRSSFLAANVDPENEELLESFQHLGCVCNEAFYGPHCEFLKYDGQPPYKPSPGEFDDFNENSEDKSQLLQPGHDIFTDPEDAEEQQPQEPMGDIALNTPDDDNDGHDNKNEPRDTPVSHSNLLFTAVIVVGSLVSIVLAVAIGLRHRVRAARRFRQKEWYGHLDKTHQKRHHNHNLHDIMAGHGSGVGSNTTPGRGKGSAVNGSHRFVLPGLENDLMQF